MNREKIDPYDKKTLEVGKHTTFGGEGVSQIREKKKLWVLVYSPRFATLLPNQTHTKIVQSITFHNPHRGPRHPLRVRLLSFMHPIALMLRASYSRCHLTYLYPQHDDDKIHSFGRIYLKAFGRYELFIWILSFIFYGINPRCVTQPTHHTIMRVIKIKRSEYKRVEYAPSRRGWSYSNFWWILLTPMLPLHKYDSPALSPKILFFHIPPTTSKYPVLISTH